MPSYQRRNGRVAVFYGRKRVTNSRGDIQYVKDLSTRKTARVAEYPQRSAKAELPGQQQVNVTRLIVDDGIIGHGPDADVGMWSQVIFAGRVWDIAAPPAYHHGTKHTRHWSIDIRERPEPVEVFLGQG